MPTLLRLDDEGRPALVDDTFAWIDDSGATVADLPDGPVIVPLALWQAAAEELRGRGPVGVWLAPHEEPEELAGDVGALDVIGVHFPVFTDGRALSTAALLRTRFGYGGQIRALGDVARDQLAAMRRCGIDAFALRADLDPERAALGLDDMDGHYQGDVLDPRPLFLRVRRDSPVDEALAADAA